MKKWWCYRNGIILFGIISLSYQTRVPIKLHMLDNESRSVIKRKITGMGFIYQLVPPILILDNNIEQEI